MMPVAAEALTRGAGTASLESGATDTVEERVSQSESIQGPGDGASANADVLDPRPPARRETAFYERVPAAAGERAESARRQDARPIVKSEDAPLSAERPAAPPGPTAAAPPDAPAPDQLEPAVQAAAAAKAAAQRVRMDPERWRVPSGGRRYAWSSPTGVSLDQVRTLHGRPFRPRRQVLGPLPYVTTCARAAAARTPHLTVPPYYINPPEIRADLTLEPFKPEGGERFRRFRAQVEMTTEQPPEDTRGARAALPATVALPVQDPPSFWRRLFRLFATG